MDNDTQGLASGRHNAPNWGRMSWNCVNVPPYRLPADTKLSPDDAQLMML